MKHLHALFNCYYDKYVAVVAVFIYKIESVVTQRSNN